MFPEVNNNVKPKTYEVNIDGYIIVESMKKNPSLFNIAINSDSDGDGFLENNEILDFFQKSVEQNIKPDEMSTIRSHEYNELVYYHEKTPDGKRVQMSLDMEKSIQRTIVTENRKPTYTKRVYPEGLIEETNYLTNQSVFYMKNLPKMTTQLV